MKKYDGTEFNRNIGAALADAEAGQTVLVTYRGTPRAVLVSFDKFSGLAFDAAVNQRREVLREIREAGGIVGDGEGSGPT